MPLLLSALLLIQPSPFTANLKLDPDALSMDQLRKHQMGYFPHSVALVNECPLGVKSGLSAALYGAIRIGNGPASLQYFAIIEEGNSSKVILDANQNWDLTDDATLSWDSTTDSDGVTNLQSTWTLRASWGSPTAESASGEYKLMVYRRLGDRKLNYTRISARTGSIKFGEKSYFVLLAENSSDALFTVPKLGDKTRQHVSFCIDLDGDGSFTAAKAMIDGKEAIMSEKLNAARPFQVDGAWWEIFPDVSGASVEFRPAAPPGEEAPKQAPVESKKLLANGTIAPDFVAFTPDGKELKLSQFRGKTVILDFWATWCGPCMASMPGLEEIYQQVKAKGVVVLSLNVWDEQPAFDQWIKTNSGSKYHFTFARDRNPDASNIAGSLYGVSGIPTLFLINKEGKIAASLVGSGNEHNLKEELAKLGIKP